jgi:hypothetical protein
MFEYCVQKLRYSEYAAYKRIRAARAARRFPAILDAVAEGRLHLAAVALLASHLTTDNAEGLLAAAVHKSKREVELLIAERFPRPDLPVRLTAISAPVPSMQEPAGPDPLRRVDAVVVTTLVEPHGSTSGAIPQLAPGPVRLSAPKIDQESQ